MPDDLFAIHVTADRKIVIPIGPAFTERDVPALVAAENALVDALRDGTEHVPAARTVTGGAA